jgi:1-acyl-sn-glycerol-3-phosphate acyltransferase
MLRLVFFVVFYVNTALFLVLGSWLLLGPRRWAMEGLRLHGLASLWWLRLICGTRFELRGHEKLPRAPASWPPSTNRRGTRSR